jgi:hypothetical protein
MDGLNLADDRALSLDCYGTLIDRESGIAAVLRPLGQGGRPRWPPTTG